MPARGVPSDAPREGRAEKNGRASPTRRRRRRTRSGRGHEEGGSEAPTPGIPRGHGAARWRWARAVRHRRRRRRLSLHLLDARGALGDRPQLGRLAGIVTGGRKIRCTVYFASTATAGSADVRLTEPSGVAFFDQKAFARRHRVRSSGATARGLRQRLGGVHFGFEYSISSPGLAFALVAVLASGGACGAGAGRSAHRSRGRRGSQDRHPGRELVPAGDRAVARPKAVEADPILANDLENSTVFAVARAWDATGPRRRA